MHAAAASEMASYTRGDHGIQPKHYRPKTAGDARQLVEEIFNRNRWDERSRLKYMELKGIEPKPLEKCTIEDLRILVAAMDKAHMVIFFD